MVYSPLIRRTPVDKLWAIWFICVIDENPGQVNARFLITRYGDEVFEAYQAYFPMLVDKYFFMDEEHGLPVTNGEGRRVAQQWQRLHKAILKL